ncbi:MAG: hypothetical protein M3238_06125 [Actinomycetota bacterium]|nr:hypothetical protein [Actinomycetota bacterium]
MPEPEEVSELAIAIDDLRSAGLIDSSPHPHLTAKGRDWLKALEEAEAQEVAELGEAAADLVLSTNGLIR